jgi:hypothetical protein
MEPLYENEMFIIIVNGLRKWPWFEKWIWGYSKNMEDFVRNPAEELRDNFFPFAIQNVKPISVVLLRFKFNNFVKEWEQGYFAETLKDNPILTPDMIRGTYKLIPLIHSWFGSRIGLWNPWITKYPNAGFMFQLLISWKYYAIPIPWISLGLRFNKQKYFQFGFGWSPQWKNYNNRYPGDTSINAVWSAKFRIGVYMKELSWNPGSEVYGYWEGTV